MVRVDLCTKYLDLVIPLLDLLGSDFHRLAILMSLSVAGHDTGAGTDGHDTGAGAHVAGHAMGAN